MKEDKPIQARLDPNQMFVPQSLDVSMLCLQHSARIHREQHEHHKHDAKHKPFYRAIRLYRLSWELSAIGPTRLTDATSE